MRWTPIDYTYLFQSGGVAGLTVDLILFPMDTIKTRLQSRQGFWTAGGFRRIYAGIGPAAVGSIPSGTELGRFTVSRSMIPPFFCSCLIFLYLRVGEELSCCQNACTVSSTPAYVCSIDGRSGKGTSCGLPILWSWDYCKPKSPPAHFRLYGPSPEVT